VIQEEFDIFIWKKYNISKAAKVQLQFLENRGRN